MIRRQNWGEVKILLEQALEVPVDERPRLFDRLGAEPALRREVEELLALEPQVGGFLDEPVLSLSTVQPEAEEGDRLGPWRLVRPLGKGGMGTVFLGERADGAFELAVAIKLLRAGLDSKDLIARFEVERHVLARLIHPNIARLLDGGTAADGRPYLVMEYVEGEPIDEYCDRLRLPIRARLEVFRTVCSAVQFAHRNLVVHRDLKPANILVTAEGTVKLLDFGVAKLLDPLADGSTSTGAPTLLGMGVAPLTPRYASPEQVRGEPILPASDVYSLGVVLYELLTGRRPYLLGSTSPAEVERVVCEVQPSRPSTAVRRAQEQTTAEGECAAAVPEALAELRGADVAWLSRRLSGDLETILLTALRKEPERRFSSVEQLADDIGFYLTEKPIRSRPDSIGYRTAKFLTRHAVASAVSGAGLVLLIAFAGAMTWQRMEIAERNREVVRERDRAEATKDFLLELIGQADPRLAKGRDITIREALDQRAGRLAAESALDPVTRADLLDALGVAYRSLGRPQDAEPWLREALALRTAVLGEEHVLVAESLHNLANVERDLGRLAEAEKLMRRALAIQRRAFPDGHRDLARGLNNLASVLREKAGAAGAMGRPVLAEAEALAREGLAMKTRLFGDVSSEVAVSLSTLAVILESAGRPAESEALLRTSIDLRRTLDGPVSPGLAKAINNLAVLLANMGRLAEAEGLHRESLAMRQKLFSEGHPDVLRSLERLSRLRLQQGDHREAAVLEDEAAKLAEDLGVNSRRTE